MLRFNSFWGSGELTPLAAACLGSFVEMGHPLTLYSYEPIKNAPKGVVLADAATVLARECLTLHKASGSLALFSDRFRYEVIASDRGAWTDCDMLCVKPMPATQDYIFGWQSENSINGAILWIPPSARLLDDLRAIFTTPRWVPPWFSRKCWIRCKLKYFRIPGFGVEDMSWGTAGPLALTYYCRRHGVDVHAAPRHVFYPVPFERTGDFLDEGCNIAQYVSDDTHCMHLWNYQLSSLAKQRLPARGAFLSRILDGTWRDALRA